jgi:hypothetical protein
MHRPIYQRAKYCTPACAEARTRPAEEIVRRRRPPPWVRGHFSKEPSAPIGGGQPSRPDRRASDPSESMFVRGTVSNRVTRSS